LGKTPSAIQQEEEEEEEEELGNRWIQEEEEVRKEGSCSWSPRKSFYVW
jgi:hypothetical protein